MLLVKQVFIFVKLFLPRDEDGALDDVRESEPFDAELPPLLVKP